MKISKLFLSLSCLLASYIALTPNKSYSVNAASSEQEKIETTTPFEDLIGDDQFKVDYLNGAYKYDLNKEIEFLNFSEYKYENSYTPSFGLYVYFYNPNYSNLPKVFSDKNKIQLSIDGTNYAKYNLIPVSVSTGDIANLFYKFKVNIDEGFHSQLNSSQRTYRVSGIELDLSQSSSIKELEIATTFIYSGYAKGCNGNEESTLTCEKEGLETIYLKVYGGTKRSGYINQGLTKAIDLHYVYFEIPNKYINSYGEPYAVSYEFYDCYLDKGIWNIDENNYYFDKRWYQCNDSNIDTRVYAEDPWTATNQPLSSDADVLWSMQGNRGEIEKYVKSNKFNEFDASPYNLYNPDFINQYPDYYSARLGQEYYYKDHLSNYSPDYLGERLFRKENADSQISKNEINDRINRYGIDYFSTKKNQKYSGIITSTIDDLVDPVTPNLEHPNYSKWEALFDCSPTWGRTQESGNTWGSLSAFECVTSRDDSNGSIYSIDKDDVTHFNNIYNSTSVNNSTMCILRFAETEYWSANIWFYRWGFDLFNWSSTYEKIGYSAFMHVIENFDIISLSFKINDEIKVIPVVSDPIRIVPNADAPVDDRPETENWWESLFNATKLNLRRIIGIVAGVILVFVALIVISKVVGLISTRRAIKASNLAIKESKRRGRDRNKHEGE